MDSRYIQSMARLQLQTLITISKLRNKNQADLARLAGVSRQAVSLWFAEKDAQEINLRSSHLKKLADGLRVSVDTLLQPLPVLADQKLTHSLETRLLWDHLYGSLADFSVGIVRGETPALARLVQVFGLFSAAKIAGNHLVWDCFPQYKLHIRPIRREQLERLWRLGKDFNLTSEPKF